MYAVGQGTEGREAASEETQRLLCEGLGLSTNRLLKMSCIERRLMVGQYYPHCPEPNKTVGITADTDLETLKILLQDQCGGLQVYCHRKWIDTRNRSNLGGVRTRCRKFTEHYGMHHGVI